MVDVCTSTIIVRYTKQGQIRADNLIVAKIIMKNSNTHMKLNIGCGYNKIAGYVNVDQSPHCSPDVVADLTKPWQFADNSVDEVVAIHILEHIGEEFFFVMQEIYRVCKNNALITIIVPFPRHDTFLIDPTHKRPIFPATMAMFSQKHNRLDIERGGRETPIGIIYDVDFDMVHHEYMVEDSYKKLFHSISEEECRRIVDSCFNVIYESKIIMKVCK